MSLIPWKNKSRSAADLQTVEQPLARIRDELTSVFDRFLGESWGPGLLGGGPAGAPWPRLDLTESDSALTVQVELPGVDPKDVQIDVTGDILTIRGEKSEQRDEQRGQFAYSERQFGSFSRMVQLPAAVDPEKVSASFKDGVLTITATKHPSAKPKRIPVRTK